MQIDNRYTHLIPTFQMKSLTDAELAQLAPKISSVTMRNIALQRLGFTEPEVETLSDECRENKQSFVCKILIMWRNKNHTDSRRVMFCATSQNRVGNIISMIL